ncbi:MAG: hypothetical protein WDW36_003160 [Sanguina aurantia]
MSNTLGVPSSSAMWGGSCCRSPTQVRVCRVRCKLVQGTSSSPQNIWLASSTIRWVAGLDGEREASAPVTWGLWSWALVRMTACASGLGVGATRVGLHGSDLRDRAQPA